MSINDLSYYELKALRQKLHIKKRANKNKGNVGVARLYEREIKRLDVVRATKEPESLNPHAHYEE